MLVDARNLTRGHRFTADLCVVGSGPAGLTIVDRLRNTNLDIVLLESGGFNLELPTQSLYRGTIAGQKYFSLDACRFRLFGGSTNRWGGWCRPLEPADYERREWLPDSGWPITESDVAPYYPDAAKLLELPNSSFDVEAWEHQLPAPFDLNGSQFENTLFQFSPQTNFGELYRSRVIDASNITTIVHANVTRMDLEPESSRVGVIHVAALDGPAFTVKARTIVLATGGIENARLLLASRSDRASGLGNENDLVGRYFMEHLHVAAGHVVPSERATNRAFYRKAPYTGVWLRGVLTPTASAQVQHQLPSTSISIESARYRVGTPFFGWPPSLMYGPVNLYRALRSGRLGRIAEALKWRAERAADLPVEFMTLKAARSARARAHFNGAVDRLYSLYFRAEQVPDRDNRVTLADRVDRLGVPQTMLQWRIAQLDRDGIAGWLRVLGQELPRAGLGTLIPPLDGWESQIIGGPHHMGTTRMSADERHGVVDRDCRVHTVENLYVAGSSVFPTGGYANPTFTIVSLALRLADTLRNRLVRS